MSGHKSVVLFYKYFVTSQLPTVFAKSADFFVDAIEDFQKKVCDELGCKGRILLAVEGINGTLSGENEETIKEYIRRMKSFHLIRDCGLPDGLSMSCCADPEDERKNHIFRDVDWKESKVEDGDIEPFPDLKISIVKEIVSTGGLVRIDEIPEATGMHLSPKEFHHAMVSSDKPVVLIDVRNTFEHDIGHFVLPETGEAAMNPEMVTFSSFDSNFCAKHADNLRDKKVLMYCTGGIRCEKASVMLKKRGVEDVSQLRGGIHRYLEEFGNDGYYKGLNFVFDQRVAIKPQNDKPPEVVGQCVECKETFDELSGSRICTVCRDLVLVCTRCQLKLREYHCRRHAKLKGCYFTFLEVFDKEELHDHIIGLERARDTLVPSSAHKNQRRTISRQIEKVRDRLKEVEEGAVMVDREAPRRCRTCTQPRPLCDGKCWGFWKGAGDSLVPQGRKHNESLTPSSTSDICPIAVGDIVVPGKDWNVLRLGEVKDRGGKVLRGKVVGIKSWAGSLENDCVSVLWNDGISRGRNQGKYQPQIYRWGVIALDGTTRMYDVKKIDDFAIVSS